MAAAQPSALKLVGTLGVAGLLSGLVLAGVFQLTWPRIERNRAEAMAAAVFKVLPGSSRSETFVLREDKLVRYEDPEGRLPAEEALFAGYSAAGELIGYAIPADGPGYMDTIALLYGLDPEAGVVIGMEVLDSRETPGLGDKIMSDEHFRANFRRLAVRPSIVPVKKGEKTQPNEVDCITGATISSESVVSILNGSTGRWLPLLEAGGEPAAGGASGTD